MAAADKAATEVAAVRTAPEEAVAAAAEQTTDLTEPAVEAPCAGAGRWQDVRMGSRLTQR